MARMWIAARATSFVGTKESRYTMHIQLERSWLGKSFESSNREPLSGVSKAILRLPIFKRFGMGYIQLRISLVVVNGDHGVYELHVLVPVDIPSS